MQRGSVPKLGGMIPQENLLISTSVTMTPSIQCVYLWATVDQEYFIVSASHEDSSKCHDVKNTTVCPVHLSVCNSGTVELI